MGNAKEIFLINLVVAMVDTNVVLVRVIAIETAIAPRVSNAEKTIVLKEGISKGMTTAVKPQKEVK